MGIAKAKRRNVEAELFEQPHDRINQQPEHGGPGRRLPSGGPRVRRRAGDLAKMEHAERVLHQRPVALGAVGGGALFTTRGGRDRRDGAELEVAVVDALHLGSCRGGNRQSRAGAARADAAAVTDADDRARHRRAKGRSQTTKGRRSILDHQVHLTVVGSADRDALAPQRDRIGASSLAAGSSRRPGRQVAATAGLGSGSGWCLMLDRGHREQAKGAQKEHGAASPTDGVRLHGKRAAAHRAHGVRVFAPHPQRSLGAICGEPTPPLEDSTTIIAGHCCHPVKRPPAAAATVTTLTPSPGATWREGVGPALSYGAIRE